MPCFVIFARTRRELECRVDLFDRTCPSNQRQMKSVSWQTGADDDHHAVIRYVVVDRMDEGAQG